MKAVARFAATAFFLYILWFLFYDFYLLEQQSLINGFIARETYYSAKLLSILPLKDTFDVSGSNILCNGRRLLRVGEECSGIVLFALFTGFIICYPGNWKNKTWFIPFGIVSIYFLNIIRMVLLSLNFKYFHSSFAFNHHITFTYSIYLFIFMLWMIWINKFGNVISNKKKQTT